MVATVAALHPAIVVDAIQERRQNLHAIGNGRALFTWSDELWFDTALSNSFGFGGQNACLLIRRYPGS